MLLTAAQTPSFATRKPDVLNLASTLSFSLPVLNTGATTAEALVITAVTLEEARRVEPTLPLSLGDLGPDNAISVKASFSNTLLTVGGRYLATVLGTYKSAGATFGFSVNRYVIVPSPVAAPVPLLAARVESVVDQAIGNWSYILFNDESSTSPRFVNAFAVDVTAPFIVTLTPTGWAADTDNSSFLLWYATDTALPYVNQIAPGASLAGFQIQILGAARVSASSPFSITSWNHATDKADLTTHGTTLTPSQF